MNCIKKGLRVYALPIEIGEEKARPSTWFQGYTEKFFYDRGVLYHHLYGWLAPVFAARFIMAKKSFMCQEVPAGKAYKLIKRELKTQNDFIYCGSCSVRGSCQQSNYSSTI